MDINKFKDSVENSHLSDETKDLIYNLLNDSENPENWQQIMEAIDFETEMNENVANEAQELIALANEQEKMIDAAASSADEEMKDLEEDVNDGIADLNADAEPEPEVPAEPAMPAMEETVTEELPETPEPMTPAAEPAQAEPVQFVPQWNQPVTETPAATQPAPFPGNQTGQ